MFIFKLILFLNPTVTAEVVNITKVRIRDITGRTVKEWRNVWITWLCLLSHASGGDEVHQSGAMER